jgi:hypothetical protein
MDFSSRGRGGWDELRRGNVTKMLDEVTETPRAAAGLTSRWRAFAKSCFGTKGETTTTSAKSDHAPARADYRKASSQCRPLPVTFGPTNCRPAVFI